MRDTMTNIAADKAVLGNRQITCGTGPFHQPDDGRGAVT